MIDRAGFNVVGPDHFDDLAEHEDEVSVPGDYVIVRWYDDDAEERAGVHLSFAEDNEGAEALRELESDAEVRENVLLVWEEDPTDDDRAMIDDCLEAK